MNLEIETTITAGWVGGIRVNRKSGGGREIIASLACYVIYEYVIENSLIYYGNSHRFNL